MINNRRSEVNILTDVLVLARVGVTKTNILYKGNLSYSQLQKYMNFLLERKLLEKQDGQTKEKSNTKVLNGSRTLYKTTEKGLKFLSTSQKLHLLMEESVID